MVVDRETPSPLQQTNVQNDLHLPIAHAVLMHDQISIESIDLPQFVTLQAIFQEEVSIYTMQAQEKTVLTMFLDIYKK
jgi:hypothetical protein